MTIFEAIYNLIQSGRQALIDILQPLIMPDWGWLVTVILPLIFVALVVLYFAYLLVRYRRSAWANVDRRPGRLTARAIPPSGVHASVPSWWPVALSVGFFFALLGLAIADPPLIGLGIVVTLAGGWGWLRSASREWRRAETRAEHGAAAHALPAGKAATAALVPPSNALVPPSRALVHRGASEVVTLPEGYAGEHEAEPPEGVHFPTPSWWPVYASAGAFFALLGLVVNLALLVGGVVLTLLAFIGWYVDSYRELKVAEGLAPRPHTRDPLAVFPRILAMIGALAVLGSVAFAIGPSLIGEWFPAQEGGPGGPGGGGPPACVPASPIEITAKDTAFDRKELCLPADTPFQLVFHNEDELLHNVAIGTLFSGDVFPGVETRTYDVPALPAGRYRFLCVVHPTMVGTAIVVPAGGPGSPPGSPAPAPTPSP